MRMRIPTPCSENLDAMPRTGDGVHCSRCDRDVVDLRRATKKRALAVIAGLRASDPEGKVCVRVLATPEGVPAFAKDPSPLARFALPAALAGSLAACAPGASLDRGTMPVAVLVAGTEQTPLSTNANGVVSGGSAPVVTPISGTRTPPEQPGVGPVPEHVEMAGGLAFAGP